MPTRWSRRMVRPGKRDVPAADPATPAKELDPTKPTQWWRKPPYPSYLPSRTFVTALTDMARDTTRGRRRLTPGEAEKAVARAKAASDELQQAIASIPNAALSEALLAVYRSVGQRGSRFQHAAEQWFDDSMERVSGWYKRRTSCSCS